jgi:hypothetical protein
MNTESAPQLKPYFTWLRGSDGSVKLARIRPADSSVVVHYQPLSKDRTRYLRRILSADGSEVLFKETVELGYAPRCSCGGNHAQTASAKIHEALGPSREPRLTSESLDGLERPRFYADDASAGADYDGGYLPGGISPEEVLDWHRERASALTPLLRHVFPAGERSERALLLLLAGLHPDQAKSALSHEGEAARDLFLAVCRSAARAMGPRDREAILAALDDPIERVRDLLRDRAEALAASVREGAGSDAVPPAIGDAGGSERLEAIVRREVQRTVAFVPRLSGEWEDLVQDGLLTAILESRRRAGESAARLERRVALAVRHRLIDKIRRQDTANRRAPEVPINADDRDEGRGVDIPDPDGDPLEMLLRQQRAHADSRRDERTQAVALAVYRESRGLARRIIRRAYLHIFRGRRTRGTMDYEADEQYPAAAAWLREAWGRHLTRALSTRADRQRPLAAA